MKLRIEKSLTIFLTSILVFLITYNTVEKVEARVIEDSLAWIEPIFLSMNFFLLSFFLIISLKKIKKALKSIKKFYFFSLAFILILAFLLRAFAAPRTHRLFFDEDIYLEIGKEILERGKGSLCNHGDSEGCYEYDLMKWPNGYPFLLALSYFIFGKSEEVGFNLVIFLSCLSILFIFLVSYLLFKDEKVAILSALLLALTPIHIIWSQTTSSEPVLLSFLTLTSFFFLLSFLSEDWKIHALALFSLAFTLQLKTEAIVLLIFFPFAFFLLDKKWKEKIDDYKLIFLWILFLILITPYLIHVFYSFKTEPWGAEEGKFGLKYAKQNIPENLWFWIAGYPTIEHPILFTFFAFFGFLRSIKQKRKEGIFLISWFFLFFFLYAFFYAGSVRYGVDVRYTLAYYPSFILLAGYGAGSLIRKNVKETFLILIGIIFLSFSFYLRSISTPAERIEEARQARYYHDFAVNFSKKIEKNCYILSHVPSIYLINGRNSLQTWFGQNLEVMNKLFEKTDCVIFDDGFWCGIEPYKSSVCKYLKENYKLEELDNIMVDSKKYTFFKLEKI